jgi:hypothetical protein
MAVKLPRESRGQYHKKSAPGPLGNLLGTTKNPQQSYLRWRNGG